MYNDDNGNFMFISIISLFPSMFDAIINHGIVKQAIAKKLLIMNILNPRDFVHDNYHSVDDRPYGGGPGMLIMAKPIKDTIKNAMLINKQAKIIYLSPQGKKLNHQNVINLLNQKNLILLCGHYEGIDERIIQNEIDEELSIGDYILSGGELPAMVLIDSIVRLIPGVLGNESSFNEDSFFNGLLKYPQYTRPRVFEDNIVPEVLLSGNHEKIRLWRMKQSLGRTWLKKPNLLKQIMLSSEQVDLLSEFQQEYSYKDKK